MARSWSTRADIVGSNYEAGNAEDRANWMRRLRNSQSALERCLSLPDAALHGSSHPAQPDRTAP